MCVHAFHHVMGSETQTLNEKYLGTGHSLQELFIAVVVPQNHVIILARHQRFQHVAVLDDRSPKQIIQIHNFTVSVLYSISVTGHNLVSAIHCFLHHHCTVTSLMESKKF